MGYRQGYLLNIAKLRPLQNHLAEHGAKLGPTYLQFLLVNGLDVTEPAGRWRNWWLALHFQQYPGCFSGSQGSWPFAKSLQHRHWIFIRKKPCWLPGVIGIGKFRVPPVPALVWMSVQIAGMSVGLTCNT